MTSEEEPTSKTEDKEEEEAKKAAEVAVHDEETETPHPKAILCWIQ